MRETVEFRVPEAHAERFLPADVGEASGTVRKLVLNIGDPLLEELKRVDRQLRAEGRAFYTAWALRRHYTRREMAEADLLHVWPKRVFEPAGEECGTVYDDTAACDHVFARTPATQICGWPVGPSVDTCGAGAQQVTPLFLDGRRIPKNVDFARTIAGEIVVSRRVVEAFRAQGLTGAEFDRVRLTDRGDTPSEDHFQLKVVGEAVELDPATRAGENPFDEVGYGRCPRGHIVGLNLLSEVTVKAGTVPATDVMATRQMVGVRRGLLRPQPILLLSPQAWRVIENARLKGLVVEVAHLSQDRESPLPTPSRSP